MMADNEAGYVEVQPTDVGNAERLVFLIKGDFRFCPDGIGNKWMRWDAKRWAPDDLGTIIEAAKTTTRAILLDAADREGKERTELVRHALQSQRAERIRAMVMLAQSAPGIPVRQADLDTDPWLLNVENGTLDLRTGELRPHRREDLITKLAPVKYDPEATCPLFEAFLDRFYAGKIDMIRFIQRFAGYSLTGDTSERLLPVFWGMGKNGKSTLLGILQRMLGDYAMSTPTDTLMLKRETGIPNDVARLRGARFVTTIETEQGRQIAEARLKSLTGNDTITARFMRGEWFDFRPQFKLWLATNHKPVIRGTDDAIWDRVTLIEHTVRIPEHERIPHYEEKLAPELPGILRWAVEGCLAWQRDGIQVPDEVRASTDSYRQDSDVIGQFLAECCRVAPSMSARASEMFAAYVQWCEDNLERPRKQKDFRAALCERGFTTKHTKRGSQWVGLGLLEDGADGAGDRVTVGDADSYSSSNARARREEWESPSPTVTLSRPPNGRDPDPLPAGPCRVCRQTAWWRQPTGSAVCAVCHPPPSPRAGREG